MRKKSAKQIFEDCNPKADVRRCPSGRATIRKLLDDYAIAAVNLYGVISRKDLVAIFNDQNSDQTTEEEIYVLLLPLVLKNEYYGFYKDLIVNACFFEDFDQVDYLLKHQENKPRYIPEKGEFLNYMYESCDINDDWRDVRHFMYDAFGYSQATSEAYRELKDYIIYGDGFREFGPILERHRISFNGNNQLQEFLGMLMAAKNATRIWENKGYSPSELHAISKKRIGRNDPCPCGSGKKYKKCCALFNDAKTSQLSASEVQLFYETWYGLMSYVNERLAIIKEKIKPQYPNPVGDMMILKVREVLWEKPDLIDDYLVATDLQQVLTPEKIEILRLWKTNHVKGMFFILGYDPEYALMLGMSPQGGDRLYGVKGISHSVEYALQKPLPAQVETILLPFKGKIIYDSFMSSMPISYGEGAKASIREMGDRAKKLGIITSLD